ncbi:MAG: hypothetical protein WBG90_13605 [Saonia sp.]
MIAEHLWIQKIRAGNVLSLLCVFLLFLSTELYSNLDDGTPNLIDTPSANHKNDSNTYIPVFPVSVLQTLATLETDKHRTALSSLEITYPNSQTVWTIPDPAEIAWSTKNMPKDKTIKFYLIKDDMVVQELGKFQNNHFVAGVYLNKTLQAGTNYRVMGIELFPEDNNHTAKFATAFFTINKASVKTTSVPKVKEEVAIRNTFDGRKINYVQELTVTSADIRIHLWDHGRKDDDIVSIYLNGEAVVSKYYLTYLKKTFDLKLDATQPNDLFLYAHNLGKFPPNTVSIEITDGTTSENIVLNSDLKSCEAVLINVKE